MHLTVVAVDNLSNNVYSVSYKIQAKKCLKTVEEQIQTMIYRLSVIRCLQPGFCSLRFSGVIP